MQTMLGLEFIVYLHEFFPHFFALFCFFAHELFFFLLVFIVVFPFNLLFWWSLIFIWCALCLIIFAFTLSPSSVKSNIQTFNDIVQFLAFCRTSEKEREKKKEKRWRKTFITIFILHEANNEHQRNEMNGNARTLPAIIMLEYQDKNRKIWYEKSTTNRVYYMKKEKKETLLVTMVMIEKHHLRYTLHLHTHMQHFCSFLFFSHLFSHLIFSRCVWVCVWIKFRFVAYVQCEKLCGVKWHRQRFFFSSLFSPLCVV